MRLDIAGFAVRNWQFTLVAFGLLTLLGLSALSSTPRSEDPHFPIPVVIVQAVLPGAEPAEIEQLVVDPIEDVLDGLDDVAEISSTSLDGAAVVAVEFDWSVNAERKYDEVVREVNSVRASLPQGLTRLEINRVRTTEVAVVQLALVSDHLPMRRLEKLADELRERLDRSPGVREARYWGVPASEVRVAVDLPRLAALQLPPTAVADALRAAGAEAPIGAAHAGERRFNIKAGGAFRDLAAVGDTPVRSVGGQVVRVRDVAQVSWAEQEAQHLTRFNGRRAVFVTVAQKDGADVGDVTRGVEAVLAEFQKTLPAGVELERGFVQARNVEKRLGRLFRDFGLALALVMITLLPLGLRAASVVMVSIPLSLLIGLAMLQALGFTVNQLAIAGFVLSLGLLVDDSIVVTENIARRLRLGEDRTEAAINGTRQITLAVLGCTATLMFAFLPLLALPEGSGAYVRSLPVTVLCTVGASLVVSLTIIPFLASRVLSRHERPDGNAILRRLNGAIHRFYSPVLRRALARPVAAIVLIGLICATAIPMLGAIGSSLFPPADTPQFLVRIETADGTSLSRTDEALRFVEKRLKAAPEVAWVASNLGRGNPQIYYNQRQRQTQTSYAEAFVSLHAWEPGESERLLDEFRKDFSAYPGARISVVTFENGPPIEAPVAVRISGTDLGVLKALAARAEQVLRETPGTRDVDNPLRLDRTDIDLGVDEAKAAALGVVAGAPRRIARLALSGEDVARFRDADGDDYPVRLRLPMDGRNELSALSELYVPTQGGASAPLGAIAELQLRSSPPQIARRDRERSVTLTANVQTGQLTSAVTADVQQRLDQAVDAPAGYRISLGGQAEAQSRSVSAMGAAMLLAVFGVLAVLVLEFGRFRTVLVVASVIPLGLFGAVTALWLTGNSLSFTALIGLVALIGIEIKNSILLVDFTEQLRRQGTPLREAIEKAGEVRFLPILLTSVTAIGGLTPLALEGSGLYSPLAIVIIGGLVTSTLLSRVATPVTYWLVSRGEEEVSPRRRWWWRRRPAGAAPARA